MLEKSIGDPSTINITTLNPPYLGAVAQAGNELLLPVGYTAVTLRELFHFLETTYYEDTQAWAGSSILQSSSTNIIAAYAASHSVSQEAAEVWFYNVWANSTVTTGNATVDAFSMPLSLAVPSTRVSLASAKMLFNASNPNSLTAPSPAATFLPNSLNTWKQSLTNALLQKALATQFGITTSQASVIALWVQSSPLSTHIIVPSLQQQYAYSGTHEMACTAWAQGTFGVQKSVATLYPAEWNVPPEYAFWQNENGLWGGEYTLPVPTCMKLIYSSPKNITDAQVLGKFLPELAAIDKDWTHLNQTWGITNSLQTTSILYYFTVANACLANSYGTPAVDYWTQHGSGLFATRTAYEWLWNFTDPLAIRLAPDSPPMSVRHNLSTPEFAISHTHPWTVGTGVGNINDVQETLVWNGFTSVPFYPNPLPVTGYTEDGQLHPFEECQDSTRLIIFSDDYARPIPLACIDSASHILDVKTYTFTPDNTTWEVNPYLGSMVAGFSNISAKYNDSPIFLSNPHFFGVPPHWLGRIGGEDVGRVNLSKDMTTAHVEPITGMVVSFMQGLQVNIYIDQNTTWFIGGDHANMYRDVMVPFMIGHVYTEIGPALAHKITSQVYLAQTAAQVIFWIFVGLCLALAFAALGAGLLTWWRDRVGKQLGYTAINQ